MWRLRLIAKREELELYELENPIDLTDQNDGKETLIKYEVKGLEVDVLVIFQKENENEQSFMLGYWLGETGLIVNLADEKMYEEVVDFVMDVLNDDIK